MAPVEPQVVVRNDTGRARYVAVLAAADTGDEDEIGFVAYTVAGSQVTFTHTEVSEDERSHGVGSFLVGAALDDVREHGLQAVPQCPFVAQFIREHAEYLDLVPADERVRVASDG